MSVGRPSLSFGIDSALGQLSEHQGEEPERVRFSVDLLGEHDRRVQALDVALHNRTEQSCPQQFGMTTRIRTGRLAPRKCLALRHIRPHHQVVDLRSGADNRGALKRKWQDLRLVEFSWKRYPCDDVVVQN